MWKTVIYFLIAAGVTAAGLFPTRSKKTRCFTVLVTAIAVFGEIFLFGFHSFHLLSGGYEKTEIPLESVQVTGNGDGGFLSRENGNELILTISDIGKKVGTVSIGCRFGKNTDFVNVRISASDESHAASLRSDIGSGQIVRGDRRSQYIVLDLTGDVGILRLALSTSRGGLFEVTSITLNEPVPLVFSPLRLLLFYVMAFALYALFTFPSLRQSYEQNPYLLEKTVGVFAILFLLLAFSVSVLVKYNGSGAFLTDWKQTDGNQITKELVDAFEHGQVSLLDLPSEDLLALDNPYDWSQRIQSGVSAKWDHLLYQGRYYSYYGIAPVLLLFLPYHLLTGYYFPTPPAVFLFGSAGILFLSLLFLEIVRKFGRTLPIGLLVCSYVILPLSSGVWYNFCSPLFYEIAQSSGFCFTCAGFYFLLRSNVIGSSRIRLTSLSLSTACLGLAVLCRPTLALYCVTSLGFLGYGFVKRLGESDSGQKRRRAIGFLAAALLPYFLLGGLQMAYNYARFGSIFDFGIQYSLTINDFTRSQYHTDFVLIGFYNFLLAAPILRPEFPYFFSNFSDLNVNGYYYIANRNAIGLFFRSLPMWGYFGCPTCAAILDRRERRRALLLWLPTCLLAPLVIIASIWESGYGVRYCCDFAVELIIGGMLVIWLLTERKAEKQTRKLIYGFFAAAACVALALNFAMIYDYFPKSGFLQAACLRFARLFTLG